MNLAGIARRLSTQVGKLSFAAPVTHVYNPLEYAWKPHKKYLTKYGKKRRPYVMLGMNPGGYGPILPV